MTVEKRKRDEPVSVKSKLITEEPAVVLGRFSGVGVADSAKFEVFKSKTGHQLVHGESDKIEYDGLSEGLGQYCIAIYDEASQTVELAPAPLVSLSAIVKAKKKMHGPAIKQSNVRNAIQRTALGEAFGTKKAKKAITNMERNRIDADQLQDMEMAIVDTVKTSTENLPSPEKRMAAMSQDRPIPPYSLEATEKEDVYPIIDGLLNKKEYDALRISTSIVQEKDEEKRLAMFPVKGSEFVETHLRAIFTQPGSHIHQVKLLYYASLLLAVYQNKRLSSRLTLTSALGDPPEHVVTGILDNFVTSRAGQFGRTKDRNFIIDPAHENKLLCYFLVLALHLDNFQVDISPLVQELSLKPSKVGELFKALGCTVKPVSSAQAESRGLAKAQVASYKVASLTAPLRLPEVAKRKRQGGR